MRIYIKGIELPKGADEHRLIIRSNGQVIIDKKTYWEEAEAVSVPPHGRLIDADALMKKIEHDTPLSAVFEKTMRRYLHNAPTIIPTEEES